MAPVEDRKVPPQAMTLWCACALQLKHLGLLKKLRGLRGMERGGSLRWIRLP